MIFLNFTLENCTDCNCDYVRAYDGSDNTAPPMGTACGSHTPDPFSASGNTMFIVFHSDAETQFDGFSSLYGGSGDGKIYLNF